MADYGKNVYATLFIISFLIISSSLLTLSKTLKSVKRDMIRITNQVSERQVLDCINQSNEIMTEFLRFSFVLNESGMITQDCPRLEKMEEQYTSLSRKCRKTLLGFERQVGGSREIYAEGQADLAIKRSVVARKNFLINQEFVVDKVNRCLRERVYKQEQA